MRRLVLLALIALGCAVHGRGAAPQKDVPVVVTAAAGSSMAAGVATAAVVTIAVGAVVVGSEQFPDPPAGTPETTAAPNDPPNRCRGCICFGKGKGPEPLPTPRKVPDGNGFEDYYTRATCQHDCSNHPGGYSGFRCSGDKAVTWFN